MAAEPKEQPVNWHGVNTCPWHHWWHHLKHHLPPRWRPAVGGGGRRREGSWAEPAAPSGGWRSDGGRRPQGAVCGRGLAPPPPAWTLASCRLSWSRISAGGCEATWWTDREAQQHPAAEAAAGSQQRPCCFLSSSDGLIILIDYFRKKKLTERFISTRGRYDSLQLCTRDTKSYFIFFPSERRHFEKHETSAR